MTLSWKMYVYQFNSAIQEVAGSKRRRLGEAGRVIND